MRVYEAVDDTSDFLDSLQFRLLLRFGNVPETLGDDDLSFDFSQRAARMMQVVTKFASAEVRLSFSNIAGHRNGSPANLVG
ncbi:MAG TPA: hypothetical protein VGR48_00930 [Terriglobales bacterium]|nr:hypothetical protein [Terriglobales bacterium]